MGYGLHVLLIYKDGIRGMEYSYCWYIGMGYGLHVLLAYRDGIWLWTTATAGILGWDMGYGLKLLLVYWDYRIFSVKS